MKTAIILMPMSMNTDRVAYLQACTTKATESNYLPLTAPSYGLTGQHQKKFVEHMIAFVDTVLLFIDCGIDKAMFDVIDAYCGKKELIYLRVNHQIIYTTGRVLKEVSMRTGISTEELRGKRGKRPVTDARMVYYRRCKEVIPGISLNAIGEMVNKDHATVLHGIKEANNCPNIINLYERCYGAKTNEQAQALGSPAEKDFSSQQIERPILPYRSMDPREQSVPDAKPAMQEMRGERYH